MWREPKRSAVRLMVLSVTFTILGSLVHHQAFAQSTSPFTTPNSGFGEDGGETSSAPPTGADGVSFMPVPLDTNINCNSVILKGTRRYQGTAFVLPRVVIAQTKMRETLFEILQTGNDQYLLRFAIYFPRTDEELSLHMKGQNVRLQGCDFGAVVTALNKNVKDEAAKVQTLSRIPISGVDVRIDGVRDKYTLGAIEGSMLHYQGLDHVVEYALTGSQLNSVIARIQGNIGLGIHIAIKFNARAGDGALYIDANLNELAAGLEAAVGGKKSIAAAELATLIEANLSKMNLNIESEAGSSRIFQVASEQIMEMIMDQLSGNDDDWNGWGSGRNGGTWRNDRFNPDRGTPFTIGLTNGPVTGGGSSAFGEEPPAGGEGSMINVQLMLKLLRTKKTFKVSYTNMGPSAQQVYSTSVLFRGEIADPDVRIMNVVGGDENARILPNRLTKDRTLTLAVAGRIPERISYVVEKKYFSAKEVTDLKLHNIFPILRDERGVLRDRATREGSVGALRAKGWFTSDFYIWGMNQAKSKTVRGKMEEVALEPSVVGALPIAVKFSKVGLRKFSLNDLLKENAYWKGVWDEMGGKILFTPKQNLGQMTIINMDKQETVRINKKAYFQERRGGREKKVLAVAAATPEKAEVPSLRTMFQLQISHDSEVGEVVATVNPEGSSSATAPVLVPGNTGGPN